MKRTLGAACTGALLMACSGMQSVPAPQVGPQAAAIAALGQACLLDPTSAERWEQLGAALEAGGEHERAATMFKQAAALRAHDVRRDYALVKEAAAQASAMTTATVDASMPRTEVRQVGAALVEVLRVAGGEQAVAESHGVKLEISNGNGVAGAAARLARTLDAEGIKATRLTNLKPFVVSISRIEYQRGQQLLAQALSQRLGLPLQVQGDKQAYADMRIVLGRDTAQARYLK